MSSEPPKTPPGAEEATSAPTSAATTSISKGSKAEKAKPAPPTPAPPSAPASSATLTSTSATSTPATTSTTTTAPSPSSISAVLAQKVLEKNTYSARMKENVKLLISKTLPTTVINEDEHLQIAAAMQYDTFDPKWMRVQFLKASNGSARRIMNVALATVFFGNNPYSRVAKAVDPSFLQNVMEDLRSMNVARKKSNSDTLTLARFGQSHPVLILKVRLWLKSKAMLPAGGVAVEGNVPMEQQDLALTPLSDVFPSVKPFITAFALALHAHHKRLNKDTKVTEDEWKANQEKFRLIAVESFKHDDVFGKMTDAQITAIPLGQVMSLLGYV